MVSSYVYCIYFVLNWLQESKHAGSGEFWYDDKLVRYENNGLGKVKVD